MDIEHKALGQITLSMSTFTEKLQLAFDLKDNVWGGLQTPGRTDKKIVRGQDPEKNEQYRSHVGAMNWLAMCLRYDLAYNTKELSRVLQEPTKTANEILRRAINYTIQTKHAHLQFNHDNMLNYKPPKTRRKPTDTEKATYDTEYFLQDGIHFHKLTINNKSRITNTQNPISLKCASPISTWQAKLKPDKAQAD
jgi:hypothetical protein